jgi:hypothetical protein
MGYDAERVVCHGKIVVGVTKDEEHMAWSGHH